MPIVTLGQLHVAVRLLSEPSLWCWEICTDEGRVIESSWTSSWTAYQSREEAESAGGARFGQLGEHAGEPEAAAHPASLPRAR
jgi:hypothetical protein